MSKELYLKATSQPKLENIDELKKVLQLIWDPLPQDLNNKATFNLSKKTLVVDTSNTC